MIFSISRIIIAFPVLFTVYYWATRFRQSRGIRRLGARAQVVRTKLPLGLDFIRRGIRAFLTHKSDAFWVQFFEESGAAAKRTWTAEVRVMNNFRVIFTCEPENIKAMLATQFQDFGKGQRFHDDWEMFLGDSIFTTDGQRWHDSRALIRPMFVKDRVVGLDLFERHVLELMTFFGDGTGKPVRVDSLLFRFSLDAATDYLLGSAVGSLRNEKLEFADAFNAVQSGQARRERAGRTLRWFLTEKSYWSGLKTIDRFLAPYIEQVLSFSPAELEAKASSSDTFIHALARFTHDPKVIRDQLVAILLAGRDTTASTLSWAFLELARHPEVVAKLRSEIVSHLGPRNRPPTYQELKDMRYLQHVLNETLRLYPVVPFNVRHSLVDTTLPTGGGLDGTEPIGVEKGTPVGYSALVMQRRRDLYLEMEGKPGWADPADFSPERWEIWTPKSWTYLPFNGGPRICIGQNFALTEMAYVLCRIFQRYEGLVNYGSPTDLHAEIVMTPGKGVDVGFLMKTNEK